MESDPIRKATSGRRLSWLRVSGRVKGLFSKSNIGQKAPHQVMENAQNVAIQIPLAKDATTDVKDTKGTITLHDAGTSQDMVAGNGHRSGQKPQAASQQQRSLNDADAKITLHIAARRGSEIVVRELLGKGHDINATDQQGNTALYVAVNSRQTTVVKLLLQKGANIVAINADGTNVLHRAVRGRMDEIVELLLANGADCNVRDLPYSTLHEAVAQNYIALVRVLLKKGADVNATYVNGGTVLHQAAMAGHKKLVALLLEHGADVHTKNRHGKTAMRLAAMRGHRNYLEDVFLKAGVKMPPVPLPSRRDEATEGELMRWD